MRVSGLFGLVTAVAASLAPAAAAAQAGPETVDRLIAQWEAAPLGSEEEARTGEELRALIEEAVGADALDAYEVYLDTEVGSAEEAESLAHARDLAGSFGGLDPDRGGELLEMYFVTLYSEDDAVAPSDGYEEAADHVGGWEEDEPFVPVGSVESVEFSLQSISVKPGAPLNLVGLFRNNGRSAIYVPEADATLEVSHPLSSLVSREADRTQFVAALLPPNLRRLQVDSLSWVAVQPGTELRMLWEIPAQGGMLSRWVTAAFGPPPGEYTLNALVPYVFGIPRGQERNRVSAAGTIRLNATLSAMLPFAWLGGLIALFFQSIGLRPTEFDLRGSVRYVLAGLIPMVALTAVVLVLSTALEGIELLPHLSISTRTATVASGMLIQFLGYRYIRDRIPGLRPSEPAGGGGGTDRAGADRQPPAEPAAAELLERPTPAGGD